MWWIDRACATLRNCFCLEIQGLHVKARYFRKSNFFHHSQLNSGQEQCIRKKIDRLVETRMVFTKGIGTTFVSQNTIHNAQQIPQQRNHFDCRIVKCNNVQTHSCIHNLSPSRRTISSNLPKEAKNKTILLAAFQRAE